jgi:hypothetical protein
VTPSSEVMRALSSLEAAYIETLTLVRRVLRFNPMLLAWKGTVSAKCVPPAFCAEGARTLNLIAQRRKVLSLLGSASAACFQNQSLPGLSQPLRRNA